MKLSTLVICFVAFQTFLFASEKDAVDGPLKLKRDQIPQFVLIASDDNYGDGLPWVLSLMDSLKNPVGIGVKSIGDGQKAGFTLFSNGTYIENQPDQLTWQLAARDSGYEIANHTINHLDCGVNDTNIKALQKEIAGNDSIFQKNKLTSAPMKGFRFPYLSFSNNALRILDSLKYDYDASLDLGDLAPFNAQNGVWPFLLNEGYSPAKVTAKSNTMWELPLTRIYYVPKNKAAAYGLDSSRDIFKDTTEVGLDYNMMDMFKNDSVRNLAYLKYTFDERRKGNKAPFSFGIHSSYYGFSQNYMPNNGARFVLSQLLHYVNSFPDVRIVSHRQMLEWLKKPVGLDGLPLLHKPKLTQARVEMSAHQIKIEGNGLVQLTLLNFLGQTLSKSSAQNQLEIKLTPSSQDRIALVQVGSEFEFFWIRSQAR